MEVDQTEDFMSWFELSPENFPWRQPIPRDVEMRRAHMSDVLIFDILLTSGGVRHPESLCPPTDVDGLRLLLNAIENTSYDLLKKDCLIYFLLKWHQDGREDKFMEERCIPPQFAALASAYWHLDSGIDLPKAVSMLSDARLNRDYPSKVLQALGLAEDPHALIRQYVQTAKPLLTEPVDIETYTIALANSRLMEAWQFQRSFSETSEMRARLVRKILDWCLTPKPRPVPLAQLVSFPFSDYEQSLVHAYAMKPPSYLPNSSVPIIQDLVCVRLIQSGQHAAAIKLDRQLSASSPQGKAPESIYKAAQDRKQMMDELMSIMPAPERLLLEIELDTLTSMPVATGEPGTSNSAQAHTDAPDMSMSWEHISKSMLNGEGSSAQASATHNPNIDDTPIIPISQRSGAPRFGGPPPNLALDDIFSSPAAASVTPAAAPSAHPLFSPGLASNTRPALVNPSGLQNGAAHAALPNAGRSLFDIAGSANQAPNAFYQPPSAGVKRPLGQDGPRVSTATATARTIPAPPLTLPVPTTSVEEPVNGDVEMQTDEGEDDDVVREAITGPPRDSRRKSQPAPVTEFTTSLFSPSVSAHEPRAKRVARTETQMKMPPGAFLESEDEPLAPPSATRERTPGQQRERTPVQQPRSPSPPRRQTRRSTQTATRGRGHRQSIPGSLMDDEDEEEEEDVVPPLPATRRSTRKPRASKTSSQGDVSEEEPQPVRRSSRRATMPAAGGSSSPEPATPRKAKPRKSTRSSGATPGPALKSGARKKRA